MLDNKNKITVLKEGLAEFNENFLMGGAECYPIIFADKPGNRTAYDYNQVRVLLPQDKRQLLLKVAAFFISVKTG